MREQIQQIQTTKTRFIENSRILVKAKVVRLREFLFTIKNTLSLKISL